MKLSEVLAVLENIPAIRVETRMTSQTLYVPEDRCFPITGRGLSSEFIGHLTILRNLSRIVPMIIEPVDEPSEATSHTWGVGSDVTADVTSNVPWGMNFEDSHTEAEVEMARYREYYTQHEQQKIRSNSSASMAEPVIQDRRVNKPVQSNSTTYQPLVREEDEPIAVSTHVPGVVKSTVRDVLSQLPPHSPRIARPPVMATHSAMESRNAGAHQQMEGDVEDVSKPVGCSASGNVHTTVKPAVMTKRPNIIQFYPMIVTLASAARKHFNHSLTLPPKVIDVMTDAVQRLVNIMEGKNMMPYGSELSIVASSLFTTAETLFTHKPALVAPNATTMFHQMHSVPHPSESAAQLADLLGHLEGLVAGFGL
jgi:hypothetical protein